MRVFFFFAHLTWVRVLLNILKLNQGHVSYGKTGAWLIRKGISGLEYNGGHVLWYIEYWKGTCDITIYKIGELPKNVYDI